MQELPDVADKWSTHRLMLVRIQISIRRLSRAILRKNPLEAQQVLLCCE